MSTIGKVWLIGAGAGTPELLTVMGRELLEQATVVFYDADAHDSFLDVCRRDALLSRCDADGQTDYVAKMLDYARTGHQVVRLLEVGERGVAEARAVTCALERAKVSHAVVPGVPKNGSFGAALQAFDSGPLFGKRILVPRPLEQARVSANLVRFRGGIPIIFPLIAIEAPEDTVAVSSVVTRLSSYDWVLLTSANGAESLIAAVRRAGKDARAFAATKLGVIGPKTAEPLLRFGLVPDVVADEHIAEGLLLSLPARSTMKRVLLYRAAEAREVLPETLRAEGVEVDVVVGYRTRRLSREGVRPLRQWLSEASLDAVLVTSSSMARSLVEALGDDAPELLSRTRLASIGRVTTETLVSLGIQVPVVARKYTVEGLLDALEASYANEVREPLC
jgi:uroporphyrinogen III methyltransferase/synthase